MGELFGASLQAVMTGKGMARVFVDHINGGRVTGAVRQRCKEWLLETMTSAFVVVFVSKVNGPVNWMRHYKVTGFPVRSLDKVRCVVEAMELLMCMTRACKDIDGDDREARCQDAIRRVVENAAADHAVLVAGFACMVGHKVQFKDVRVPSDMSKFLTFFGPVFDTLSLVQPLVKDLNRDMGEKQK